METQLRNRLRAALNGQSPETVVQALGPRYGKANSLRFSLGGQYFGKVSLGVLLMLDPGAGPLVLEYLKQEARR